MRKSVKTSLTLRIFLITCLILFSASAVTYGVIALVTPITYTSLAADSFREAAVSLSIQLEETTLEDCGPVIDRFILDTGAAVTVEDIAGAVVETPSQLNIHAVCENEAVAAMDSVAVAGGEGEGRQEVFTVTTNTLGYPFSFKEDPQAYYLYISPPMERENRTLQALGRVAPCLLAAMLLFSVLCALFYSRWITRPIVRLSAISQRMAELDFTQRCGEGREDEIGILGQNLDALSRRLSATLEDLNEANARLRLDIDRERTLEHQRLAFFSAASHELKTPLTILQGQLTGMLEGIGVYRDRDRYLAKALQVTGRMEGLVRELLAVARMETDGFDLRPRQLDLAELVRRRLALYEDLILRKALRVETALPPAAPVTGSPDMLQRVLDNLLSNAVFYAPEGALLSVAVESGPDGAMVLAVENSGSHIPEEALPHVFEAFYRTDASRNRQTGGSGLGLYLVKMILDRHGASCQAENTRTGVRFTVRFH